MFSYVTDMSIPPAIHKVVQAMDDSLSQADAMVVCSRAAGQLTKEHIYALANERHREGVGLNFYQDAGDAVSIDKAADADAIGLRVDKAGFAQRLFGGDIKAVNFDALWIPVDPESRGKSAGEFKGELFSIFNTLTGKGVGIRKSDKKVLFALRREIHQDPDPSVLPTDEEYAAAILAGIGELTEFRVDAGATGLDGMEVTQ